jgi:predicted O-methyltransferase YrrM
MDKLFDEILAEYETRALRDEERMRDLPMEERMKRRDELLLQVGPESARILHSLIVGLHAQNIVELGTSYGYSTLWLADAARQVGGTVITVELADDKQTYAKEMLCRAGLDSYVDFRCGDALTILDALAGPVEFVFVDLWKDLYIPCFKLFYPKLATGALVVADNMIYPEMWQSEVAAYRAHVRALPGVESILLPTGSGLEISRIVK